MAGPNLNVQRDSVKLLNETDQLRRKYNGSYAWGIDPADLGLIRLLAKGEKKKIVSKLDEDTKRKLISFIKYFPLSANPRRPDYVDFLAAEFPQLLIEYGSIDPDESHPLDTESDSERKIAINPDSAIKERLSRLLEKEEFAKGYLDHLSKATANNRVRPILDLNNVPAVVKESYVQQNRLDQLKYSNRNALMMTIKPFLSWLPWMVTRWLFGTTTNHIAGAFVNSAPAAGSYAGAMRAIQEPAVMPGSPPRRDEPAAHPTYSPLPQTQPYSPAPTSRTVYSPPRRLTEKDEVPAAHVYSPLPALQPERQRDYSPPPQGGGRTIVELCQAPGPGGSPG